MTKNGRTSQTDVIFVVMDALVNVFVGEVLIRYCHENGDCQAIRNAHAFDPSCSDQLMVANQNAHAFRPNSTVANMRSMIMGCQIPWNQETLSFVQSALASTLQGPQPLVLQLWWLLQPSRLLSVTLEGWGPSISGGFLAVTLHRDADQSQKGDQ